MNRRPAPRDIRVDSYSLWLWLNIALFLALSALLQQGMFAHGEQDGFFIQMQHAKEFSFSDAASLKIVHYFRYLTIAPFYWIWSHGLHPLFEALVILVFLAPVLTIRFAGYRHPAQALLVYLPLFISYRSVLVACAMAYLFIFMFLENRRYLLLLVSAFLANLSSGVVLVWVMLVAFNSRTVFYRNKILMFAFALMITGFVFSLLHKIGFFSDLSGGKSSATTEALARSTLVASYLTGQYLRAAFYAMLLLLLLFVVFCGAYYGMTLKAAVFYGLALPSFFFEGLGVLSYLIPVVWFFLYFLSGRLPELRPHRYPHLFRRLHRTLRLR